MWCSRTKQSLADVAYEWLRDHVLPGFLTKPRRRYRFWINERPVGRLDYFLLTLGEIAKKLPSNPSVDIYSPPGESLERDSLWGGWGK